MTRNTTRALTVEQYQGGGMVVVLGSSRALDECGVRPWSMRAYVTGDGEIVVDLANILGGIFDG